MLGLDPSAKGLSKVTSHCAQIHAGSRFLSSPGENQQENLQSISKDTFFAQKGDSFLFICCLKPGAGRLWNSPVVRNDGSQGSGASAPCRALLPAPAALQPLQMCFHNPEWLFSTLSCSGISPWQVSVGLQAASSPWVHLHAPVGWAGRGLCWSVGCF